MQELPGRNPRFTGREDDLRHIRRMFRKAPTVVLATGGQVALQGMGGIGKSQLALEYAHRFHLAYDVVWWIDADRVGGIEESLDDLGVQLSVPMAGSSQDIARAVLHALRHTEHRWLLVLDNAEDVPGVSQFLPAGKGHVLITSRSSLWGERVTPVTVDVFKRAESIQHLSGRVPTIRVDEADQIARLLGDLPIAVAAAAAWLADTGHSVDDYLSEIAKYGPSILVEPQTNLTVEATWDLSLALLRERSPAAYRLLQLCSVFAPEISLDLVYSDAFAAALIPLDPQASEELVRAAAGAAGQPPGAAARRPARGQRVRRRPRPQRPGPDAPAAPARGPLPDDRRPARRGPPPGAPGAGRAPGPRARWTTRTPGPGCARIWPHLEVSKAAQSHEESVRNLLIDRLRYLWVRGDLENGRRFGQEISKIWTAMLLDTDLKEAGVLRRQLLHLQFNLGNILSYQGRFEESRLLDEEVLGRQRALLAPDHPHTLMTAGGLARDLRGAGPVPRGARARPGHLQRLAGAVRRGAPAYPRGAQQPGHLAAADGRLPRGPPQRRARAARRRTKVLGDTTRTPSRRPTTSAGTCGTPASTRRRWRGSGGSTPDCSQTLGGDALQTLRVQCQPRGVAAQRRPARPRRREMLETAYERLNEIFGPDNPDTLTCRLSLSVNLLAVDLDQRAGRELQAVHDIYRRNLGPDHPQTLVCVLDLAMVARRIGDSRRARELAGAAAERFTDVLGDQHPYALSARMNQAICIAEDTDPPEGRDDALRVARDALENVSARMDEVLGPTHPNALRCRANVVLARSRDGDGLQREVGALMRELATRIGDHHPAVVALRERRFLHRIIDPHPF